MVDVGSHDDVREAIAANRSYVERETLTTELVVVGGREHVSNSHRIELPDGRAIHAALSASA